MGTPARSSCGASAVCWVLPLAGQGIVSLSWAESGGRTGGVCAFDFDSRQLQPAERCRRPRSSLTILAVRFLTAPDQLTNNGGLALLIFFTVLFGLLAMQKPDVTRLF